MKGMKCRCGFSTTSQRQKCPRCGRPMKPAEWANEGRVLSFTQLQAIPEGLTDPHDLAMVEIAGRGPKVVCWTNTKLEEDERVLVTDSDGKYVCVPEARPKERPSKPDR